MWRSMVKLLMQSLPMALEGQQDQRRGGGGGACVGGGGSEGWLVGTAPPLGSPLPLPESCRKVQERLRRRRVWVAEQS